ncbi:MAG: ABC-type sugar transport system, periplasmic component [Planctomycetota bacterium]|nr:ABC-type sugar transport system, periplasmic component [Planctomycetota bacterium]
MAAGLAVIVAGCGGSEKAGAPKTGDAASGSKGDVAPKGDGKGAVKLLFVTNSNADWWNAVEKGMQDGGKEFGVEVSMRRNEGSTQGQIDRLQEALSLDVQGVAVSVIEADAPGVADAMRALQKAGKVVIAIDSDIEPKSADVRSAYIGTNNVKAGEAAGKAAAAVRPKGGKVAVFVGTSGAANARERKQGFFQGAGPAFKEVETLDDNGDHARARDNVQTALSKYTDLDLLLGLWSYNAPAIAEEVAKNPDVRKRTTVVTFDLDEAAVGELEKGHIDASVCQNPYEMGFQGVKLLKALINKDAKTVKDVLPDGKTRDTGVRVIVPKGDSPVKAENVITIEEMKSWLQSKGLKSS